MTRDDFLTGLEMELQLRAVPFERRELATWVENVWPLAEEHPDAWRLKRFELGANRRGAVRRRWTLRR